MNGAFLPGAFGTLDANGQATPSPRVALGLLPALTPLCGMRFNALGVVVTSKGRFPATNPLGWVFR